MPKNLSQHRETLLKTSKKIRNLLVSLHVKTDELEKVEAELNSGYLKVVVIAEINTGKSTFLNALMGAKVFPSRAVPWTASITVLDHAENPRAEVYTKNGKCQKIDLDREKPIATLKSIVSKKNADVQNIQEVKVWFPNPFTQQGIVLVDTPGVNDPANWREEITIQYLPEADAAIMLFDPQSTWTSSEKEFLTEKVMKSNISNFTFVINRKDEVSEADLPKSVNRLRTELEKIIPNPKIRAVSSLNALNAKLEKDDQALENSGFPELEKLLMDSLFHGSAGTLFLSKIIRIQESLALVGEHIKTRQSALSMSRGDFQEKLTTSRSSFRTAKDLLSQTQKQLNAEGSTLSNRIQQSINKSLEGYRGQNPSDEDSARSLLNTAIRDGNDGLRTAAETLFLEMKNKYSRLTQSQLASSDLNFLDQLNVSVQLKTKRVKTMSRETKDIVGIGIGALIGFGLFSFFTGGLGLIAGLGALAAGKMGTSVAKGLGDNTDSYSTKVDFKGSFRQLEKTLNNAIPNLSKRMIELLSDQCIDRLQKRIEQQDDILKSAETLMQKNKSDQQPERNFITKINRDYQTICSELTSYRNSLESELNATS